jgi:hypothetical protein
VAASARLDPARRRAAAAKRTLAVAAGVGFALAFGLARATHPGHASTPVGTSNDTASSSSDDGGQVAGGGFSFDDGSLGQSSGGAQFGTHVS